MPIRTFTYAILIGILFFNGANLHAASYQDSLWTVYEESPTDTCKIDALLALSYLLSKEKLDSAKIIAEIALEKALLIEDKKRLADIYFRLAIICGNQQQLQKVREYDSLALVIYEDLQDKKGIIDIWINEGIIERLLGNADEAEALFNKSIIVAKKEGYKKGIIEAYLELGYIYYYYINKPIKGLDYYDKVFELYQNLNEKEKSETAHTIIYAHIDVGYIYECKKQYAQAIQEYLKGLEIAQKNNKYLQNENYLHIGNLYAELENYTLASQYIKKSLESVEKLNDSIRIGSTYAHLGNLQMKKKEYEKAITYFNNGLAYVSNSPDIFYYTLIDLASAYISVDNLDKTWEVVQKIDANRLHQTEQQAYYNFLITNLFVAENKWEEALPFGKKAYKLSKGLIPPGKERRLLNQLVKIHQNLHNYRQALEYAQLGQAVSDSLFNEQKIRTTQRLVLDYETEKKENAITLLERQRMLQRTQLQSQQYATILWGILGISSILLSGLLFIFRQRSKQLAVKVAEQRVKIQNLFGNIFHEFRTPLSILKIPLEELTTSQFNGNFQRVHQMMLNNVYRLTELVHQMVDSVKLRENQLDLNLKRGNPENFIQTLVEQFSLHAQHKNIDLLLEAPVHYLPIHYDGEVLAKILNNLMTNAIEFTALGQVKVSFKYLPTQVEIQVNDTGIGIPKEDVSTLFEHYYLDPLNKDKVMSTGLGLSIVKELVELCGGTIEVKSKYGEGSTFTVQLPHQENFELTELPKEYIVVPLNTIVDIRNNATPTLTSSLNSQLGLILSGHLTLNNNLKKVLIVEDSSDLNALICNSLAKKYLVYQAFNGVEGYEMVKRINPDIIIADIMMNQMDGLSLAKKLQASDENNHIPLIIVSALGEAQKKQQALEVGAIDFIDKPLDMTVLEMKIDNLLSKQEKLKQYFKQQNRLDRLEERQLVNKDKAFLQELRNVVIDNISDPELNVEQLSQFFNINRVSLYRKVKSLTGLTPTETIYKTKMQYAYELLKQRKNSIKEIASMVGMKNPSFFSRKFKQEFGITPSKVFEYEN